MCVNVIGCVYGCESYVVLDECDELPPPPCSKRHILPAVKLSLRLQTAVQIVSKPPTPSIGGTNYHFWQTGHADSLDGW